MLIQVHHQVPLISNTPRIVMSSQRGVHNRIHTLRGEQFRHLQNLRGSRSHLSSTNIHAVPSLPLRLLSLADPSFNLTNHDLGSTSQQVGSISKDDSEAGESQFDGTSVRSPAGPSPPKSWTLNSRKDIRETAAWRSEALSLIFKELLNPSIPSTYYQDHSVARNPPFAPNNPCSGSSHVPPLSLLCLQIFLTSCTSSKFHEIVPYMPYIPPHLQKDLIRFTAVHSPLPSSRLFALFEAKGHADGEMIVVGPGVTLRDDYFIRSHSGNRCKVDLHGSYDPEYREQDKDCDWDAEDEDTDFSLSTLILLNTSISSSILLSFPPTLTHLALINLFTPVPIHRLPAVCPLLTVFDLSYNSWLGAVFGPGEQAGLLKPQQPRDPMIAAIVDLGRVDWALWNHLKVLGFRGNYVPGHFVNNVNKGRWEDIRVVL